MKLLDWLRCVLSRNSCALDDDDTEQRARRIEEEHARLQRRLNELNAMSVRAAMVERAREDQRRAGIR